MSVSLTGNDTIIVGQNGLEPRIMKDLADGDVGNLDFPNNLVEAKSGKNGNTIFALNVQGKVATLTLRVLRGSPDDKYLNARMNEYLNDPASFILLGGEIVKRAGDGAGGVTSDIYRNSGGIIQKMPGVKENVEGDTEQAVTIWQIVYANNERTMS